MILLENKVKNGDARSAEMEQKRARLRALERAQFGVESFEAFVGRVMPSYMPVPEHLQPLYDLIERSRHEPIRALLSMPPRHGKTETLRLAIAWRTLYDPACLNAYASYGADLSEETGRAVRNMAKAIGVQVGRTEVASNKSGSGKVMDWKTSYGGGLKSTSVGGGITGRGITGILVIDDPIKGHEAAYSLLERGRVWRWLRMDILSRLEGGASCIIVQTRWHEDDPIGRMQAGGVDWEAGLGEKWISINLPAIHDGNGNPVDDKERPDLATPLWTSINSRFPNDRAAAMDWYKVCRARGEYEWWSLYQGVPRSEDRKVFGGDAGIFSLPLRFVGKRGLIVCDPAATAKTASDYSAIGAFFMQGYGDNTVMRKVQPRFGDPFFEEIVNPNPSIMFVHEVWKGKEPMPAVIKRCKKWQDHYRLGVGFETVGGFAAVQDVIDVTEPGMKIIPILTGGKDKYTRAIPSSKAWRDGRIVVPSGSFGPEIGRALVEPSGWDVAGYIRIMKAFTGLGDVEDDVVDVTAHGWNRLYRHQAPSSSYRSL